MLARGDVGDGLPVAHTHAPSARARPRPSATGRLAPARGSWRSSARACWAAAASVVDGSGFRHTTVAHIAERARVSRRNLDDLFDDREDCLLAVFEDAVGRLGAQAIRRGGLARLAPIWCALVRAGSAGDPGRFLDSALALVRLRVVQTLRSGTWPSGRRCERRSRNSRGFSTKSWRERPRRHPCSPATAEGLVGGGGLRLLRAAVTYESEPLVGLFGEFRWK